MPCSWAKQPWEQDQEQNLIYVAYTRAMEKLTIGRNISSIMGNADEDESGI